MILKAFPICWYSLKPTTPPLRFLRLRCSAQLVIFLILVRLCAETVAGPPDPVPVQGLSWTVQLGEDWLELQHGVK